VSDLPTIEAIRTHAVIVPLERPLRTASGEMAAAPLLLFDIATSADITGRAYVFGYSPITLVPMASLAASLSDLLAGKPIAPVARMNDMDRAFRLLGRQGLLGMVMSGIDMALWDAQARLHDRAVVELLGGECRPVPAYDSLSLIDPDADREMLEASLERGFKAIKIKVGDAGLDTDIAAVSGLREIAGPETALMIDYNQSLTATEAMRRVSALEEFGLHWVEEPVPAEDLVGHAEVRASCGVPVQTGENWWFPQDMAHAIAAEACDYAMPDLMKIGGITGWLRAMGQAEAASIPVSSHLFPEASAHVLPVTPTAHWLEYLDVASAVLRDPAEIVDGSLTAKGPGLGLDWDEDAVRRFAV